MMRFPLLIGFGLLMTDYSLAQDSPDPTPMQCHLIKLAVARYGYAAARQHALETYGPEAVKTGDKCFTNETVSGTGSQVPKELGVAGSAGTK